MNKKYLITGGLVATGLFVFAASQWHSSTSKVIGVEKGVSATVVKTQEFPAVTNIEVSQKIQGKVEAVYSAKLGTVISGSYVKDMYVSEGDMIKKGQLLARIDDRQALNSAEVAKLSTDKAKAQRAVLVAQLEEAQASLKKVQSQLSRDVALKEVGAVSQEAIESRTTELQVSQKRVEALQAQLVANDLDLKSAQADSSSAQLRQQYTNIIAPFDGTVAKIDAAPGEVVSSNVLSVYSNAMRAVFNTGLSVAEQHPILMVDGKPISYSITTHDNAVTLYAKFNGVIGAGVSGELKYKVTGQAVPTKVLVKKGEQWYIWIAQKHEGKWLAKKIPVQLAEPVMEQAVIINQPSLKGKYITSGVDYLFEGVTVELGE